MNPLQKIYAAGRVFLLLAAGLFLLFFSCKREGPASERAVVTPEMSPEEVVKLYQSYMDRIMFAEAMTLSTDEEKERLAEVMRILQRESPDSTRSTSVFLKMKCNVEKDRAECFCRIKDEFDTYNTMFVLLRINDRWLMDAPPEEEIYFDEEAMDNVLDSLLENQ